MPSYKTHDTVAIIAAPVLFTGVIITSTNLILASTITATFLLSNYYLSPDLDIDSIMMKRWGVLYFIWYPYKKVFSHRSIWTHSGPLSATIRALYLGIILLPIILFFNISVPLIAILFLYIGMILADTLHSLLDWIL